MGGNINPHLEDEVFKKKYEMDQELKTQGKQKLTWPKIVEDGVDYNYKRIIGRVK